MKGNMVLQLRALTDTSLNLSSVSRAFGGGYEAATEAFPLLGLDNN